MSEHGERPTEIFERFGGTQMSQRVPGNDERLRRVPEDVDTPILELELSSLQDQPTACNVYAPLIEGFPASPELRLRSTDLFWQAVEGDVVVLDLRKDLYLEVNRSGALLWELMAGGTTRTELVDRLVREYDLAPERAVVDVDRLLEELSARDLLERPTPS